MKIFSIKRVTSTIKIGGHNGYQVCVYKLFFGIKIGVILEYYLTRQYLSKPLISGIMNMIDECISPITEKRPYYSNKYEDMMYCDNNPIIKGYRCDYRSKEEVLPHMDKIVYI